MIWKNHSPSIAKQIAILYDVRLYQDYHREDNNCITCPTGKHLALVILAEAWWWEMKVVSGRSSGLFQQVLHRSSSFLDLCTYRHIIPVISYDRYGKGFCTNKLLLFLSSLLRILGLLLNGGLWVKAICWEVLQCISTFSGLKNTIGLYVRSSVSSVQYYGDPLMPMQRSLF